MVTPPASRDLDRAVRTRRRARSLSILVLLFVMPGCSWEWAHRIYPLPFYESSVTVGGTPDRMRAMNGKIAVLPFAFEQKANAERQEAVDTLRGSFDLALGRLRSYGLVPIADVDERLATAGISPDKIATMNPAALGKITDAEVLLYGDVKRTRNMTLYVYSHTVYEGTFRLVEAATGDILWSGRLWEGMRGGLFINLFLIEMFMNQPDNRRLPDAYRRDANVMVRKLVEEIPEPLSPDAEPPPVAQGGFAMSRSAGICALLALAWLAAGCASEPIYQNTGRPAGAPPWRTVMLPVAPASPVEGEPAPGFSFDLLNEVRRCVALEIPQEYYRLISLPRVDHAVPLSEGPVEDEEATARAGRAMDADLVIRPELFSWKRRYYIVHSVARVGVRVKIYDGKTGALLAESSHEQGQEPGVPEDPRLATAVRSTAPSAGSCTPR